MEPEEEFEQAPSQVAWKDGWSLFKRFWPYLRPEKRAIWVYGLLMLLSVPTGVISPYLVQRIFDEALPQRDVGYLIELSLIMIGLTLLGQAIGYVQSLVAIGMSNRTRFRLMSRLFDHVLRLPLGYFHRTETGYLMSRIRDDMGQLYGLMGDTLVNVVVDLFRAVLYFVLLLTLDPGLALSGFALVAVIFLGVALVSRPLRRRSEAARESDAQSSGSLQEVLTGLATVRTAAQERRERHRFLRTVKDLTRKRASREVLGAATGTAIGSVAGLGAYVIVAVGAYRILNDLTTFGSLFAFFIFLTQMMSASGTVFGVVPAAQLGFASLERIFGVMDEPRESAEGQRRLPAIRGRLAFEQVHFQYDDETIALRGIELTVEPGEVLALVGRSGSGKTTLVSLISRLYDPTEGRIRLDGHLLPEFSLDWLRRHVGVVPQDVFLFNRTIRENIAYACPQATEERILSAARAAHAHEFIEQLPKGYDTVVGERGVRLSGGEKQRLAIAREILRDPPILILDEATSSLDSESEALIRDAMQTVMQRRTCFVIAHRLSTVRNADRIVVLDQGQIVEAGSHDALLAQNGLYRELHDKQFQSTDESS